MSIAIPANVAYPNTPVALPSNMLDDPTEGRKFVPLELLWGSMGGSAKCIYVNLTANAYLDFRKISAMWVDNSQCGSDTTFIFPTVSTTVVVPSYESVMVPVPANVTEFYVSCGSALAVDVTRLDVFNFVPPPVVLPKTAFQNAANAVGVALSLGTDVLIPNTVQGTLEGIDISIAYNTTAAFAMTMAIQDGTGTGILAGGAQGPNPSNGSLHVIHFEQINYRFAQGIQLVIGGTLPNNTPTLFTSILYRTP